MSSSGNIFNQTNSSSTNWQPEEQSLKQIVQLINYSTTAGNQDQHQVHQKLESFNEHPEYNKYLGHILLYGYNEGSTIRSTAGFILKNNIKQKLSKFTPDCVDYLKINLLRNLCEKDALIRNTITIVISTLVSTLNINNWPEITFELVDVINSSMSSSQDFPTVEGTLATLEKICDECAMDLDSLVNYKGRESKPADAIFPVIINLLESQNTRLRYLSLKTLNSFIIYEPSVLVENLEILLEKMMYKLCQDTDIEISKLVCQSFVMILEIRPDKLITKLDPIVNFMLSHTQSNNEDIALEACEFWLAFVEHPELKEKFIQYVPIVVPVIMKCMRFSQEEKERLEQENQNSSNLKENIRPTHHHSKTHESAHKTTDNNISASGNQENIQDDNDEYEDDCSDDEEDEFADWNLRKCSAAALDVISTTYNDQILPIILPIIKNKLSNNEDWLEKESAILALGAISEGCMKGMAPYLPELIPYLIQNLNTENNVQIKTITAWSLGRYSSFYVSQDQTHKQRFLLPVMEALLKSMLDNNSKVQMSSAGAFVTLEEEVSVELVPFIKPILQHLIAAFPTYSTKSLISLYDALATLADVVGTHLSEPEHINVMMPPLIKRWNEIIDFEYDVDFLALLECFSSIVIAIGTNFLQFSQPIYERCIKIISYCITQHQQQHLTTELLDKDYITVSLDLISSIVQAINQNSINLVSKDSCPLNEILIICLQDENNDVRQSAYALIGDLTIYAFDYLKNHTEKIIQLISQEIKPKPDAVYVCNNAVWSLGEMSLKLGSLMESYVNLLLEKLIPILLEQSTSVSLAENVAICIGRLALGCPHHVAPHLNKISLKWCLSMKHLQDNSEKETAVDGFCDIIALNPNGLSQAFHPFCEVVANIDKASNKLFVKINNIFQSYKQMLQSEFTNLINMLPKETKEKLQSKYTLN